MVHVILLNTSVIRLSVPVIAIVPQIRQSWISTFNDANQQDRRGPWRSGYTFAS